MLGDPKFFRRMGSGLSAAIINQDQEAFGNVRLSERKQPSGYCTSHFCTRKAAQKKVFKTKDTSIDTCQDCGSFLFWRTR